MSIISYLQNWYEKSSKSEHSTGIQIMTESNGSWCVFIDLFDTECEIKNFQPINFINDNSNWIQCLKENHIFKGYGGAQSLETILTIFYNWATSN